MIRALLADEARKRAPASRRAALSSYYCQTDVELCLIMYLLSLIVLLLLLLLK